jgi:hypothetical protein
MKVEIELTEQEFDSLPELMEWIDKRKNHYFRDVIFTDNFDYIAPERIARHERCVQMLTILGKEEAMLKKISDSARVEISDGDEL